MSLTSVWTALQSDPIRIDGFDQPLRVTVEEVRDGYLPLAQRLWKLQRSLGRRMLVGISGLPGSGKTVTAATLARVLDVLGQAHGGQAIHLSLDGFHRPNAWLESHTGPDYDGHTVILRTIKGAPNTFDAETAARLLRRVRESEDEVPFPVYSRVLHDPIPGAVRVTSSHRIVVFEGNYLFLDLPPWPVLRGLFDVRMFVKTPEQARLRNLRERHRRGGKSPAEIDRQIREVDQRNATLIASSSRWAHAWLLRSDDGMALQEVQWRNASD
ncbi:MAG: nucleoside/nucleotide kinase family protein [Anaerolineae bacterium]|nr:nucleoside/nucleotide kinase family protein [Anaerolineae bacterium]